MVLQVLQPWQCPVSRLWLCSPSCQLRELQGASSTAEKQGLVLLADLSLPARQSRAYIQSPYITSGYIIYLAQNGQVSNSVLRHKAKKNLSYLEA